MLWLLMLASFTVHATTVLVQGAQSPTLDYKAMLKAHPAYVSPSADYLSTHPLVQNRENLLNQFADAQKTFLQQTNEDARAKFSELLTLLPRDDWDKSDREIFLQAYLRLAQMETNAALRDRWLNLSLLLGSVGFDENLYPPPLLQRRKELEQHSRKNNLSRANLNAGWSQVLVNGQPCHKQDCGLWPQIAGPVRVTVLSDQWLPQSVNLELAEFKRYRPESVNWVEGDCAQAHWHPAASRLQNKKAFWSMSCEKPEAALALTPASEPLPAPDTPLSSIAIFKEAPPPQPIYQSKWFWAGMGTVIAAIIIINSQKKESVEPTTSYGFR